MPFKFNPFSGNFDQTGSGGGGSSYIDGEVAAYGDLSLDAGVAPLNSAWLVREASGVWPVSRKQAGIYIRTATAGSSRDADYTYAGTMPDVFSDAVLTIYDEASTTRTGQFNLGSVTAGQNRVLTWPNANGTIALTSDIPSSVTSVSGTAPIVSSGGTTPAISIQNSPTLTGDVTINGASTGVTGSLKVGNTTGSFNRDVEIGGNGIVLRNVGGSGTTTIALGQGSTSSYTLTPPAASGTIALTSNTVSSVASSASDVLGVSGSDITGVDAGSADRMVFWDDSASKLTYLEAGSGLSISGTTITATASGGSKTYAVFTAEHNQPPSTAFATLDTRNSIAVLDFDAATDENAVFVGIMPEAASLGSGLIVRLHWMATSATSGNVRWGVQLERSNTDLDADSFDTAVEATAATNGTSGIITTTAITVTTIDGITAGDVFRLKVFRNADDATNDTMTGDAELVAVEVRSAA